MVLSINRINKCSFIVNAKIYLCQNRLQGLRVEVRGLKVHILHAAGHGSIPSNRVLYIEQ